jgi:cell division protein FtsI (penicillin-binding protein 3)/stage V sporulation protein D (sporulation-specific penicillin-binding protein)
MGTLYIRNRLTLALCCIAAMGVVVSWRLYDIGIRRHAWYAEVAATQEIGAANVLARGNIYLTDGAGNDFLVATNQSSKTLTVSLRSVSPERASELGEWVALITGADAEWVKAVLESGSDGSRTLAKRLTDEQVRAIEEFDDDALSIVAEMDRTYPAGDLAADSIGFLGYGDKGRSGQYGVESFYDAQLKGLSPAGSVSSGLWGKLLGGGRQELDYQPHDLALTIDKNIQSYAQEVLGGVLKRYNAASGTLIVQEPSTGRLLAIADSPSYDPNQYAAAPIASFMNGALIPFEPGSSFKPVTMAAGIEAGVINPDSIFHDDGDVVIDGYTIRNFNEKHFGQVTMSQVLEKSINTGTMHVATLLGGDAFREAVVNSGFGQETGIDLAGESAGTVENLYSGRRINILTASFGQGLTVTPLQLINFYSAIANGGKLMRPYILAEERRDGTVVRRTEPEVLGTPMRETTAAQLRGMLVSVVDKGFDKARIERYDVAGKTGTAQIASPEGGYLDGQYNHSFVGFAPASSPRFTILIKMERPQGITFAADSLSPAFRDMALFLLNYFTIPPTR